MLHFERDLWTSGNTYVAGIDEVGRGALAGPMVVCAVVLDKNRLPDFDDLPEDKKLYTFINDSKKVTPKRRLILSDYLINEVLSYSIIEIPHFELDEFGLVTCTQKAFAEAVKKLSVKPHHVLTDNYEIPTIASSSQTNLIRGDNKSMTIAAASIMAKVYRDNLMIELHERSDKYKVYGFDKHKGYGTLLHREMIKKHGYSDVHRKSFHIKSV